MVFLTFDKDIKEKYKKFIYINKKSVYLNCSEVEIVFILGQFY